MSRTIHTLNLDVIGVSTSVLCALHCAALPFLLTLAPLAGLKFLSNPWVDYFIILVSFCIATYALIHGYRRHHQKSIALVIVTVGFLLIGSSYLFETGWKQILMTSGGAMVVATAHLINWKLVKQSHVEYPKCLNHRKLQDDV